MANRWLSSVIQTRIKTRARQADAFTLVEVALALGIAGFAVVSLFGTLSVGLHTIHDASVDMTNAQIIAEVSSTLQQTPFNQLQSFAQSPLYFDMVGRQLASAGSALYRVQLAVNPSGSTTYPGAPAMLGTSAMTAQIAVYPLNAPPGSTVTSSQAVLLIPKS